MCCANSLGGLRSEEGLAEARWGREACVAGGFFSFSGHWWLMGEGK